MWDLGHCNKKRCTGTRLVRMKLVEELRFGATFPGIILSPNGKSVVSREDADLIASKGIAVVDCSWNRLDEVPFREFHLQADPNPIENCLCSFSPCNSSFNKKGDL